MQDKSESPRAELEHQAARAKAAGINRITVLAYRDIDDEAAGGSELHAHEVLARWADVGLDVTARTVAAPGHPEHVERNGYQVHRSGGRMVGVPRISLEGATRRLPATDAVVEIWNGLPFWTPAWWRGPRLVVLHHLHDKLWDAFFPAPLDRIGSTVERKLAPWVYRGSPVATLAPSGRQDLIKRTPLKPEQVHVVLPGVAEDFIAADAVAPAPNPLIVAVGRLTSAKRFDVLIRSVAALVDEIDDLSLVIVGEGPERPVLEALIDRLGLNDHVQLVGRTERSELIAWYQRAWVVASASISEGWGMTLTEAAAVGTPTVATDIVGHRDAVGAGAGILAASDLEFESALRKLVTDHGYRQLLSQEARAAGGLSWDATASGLLRLLTDDAAGRG